VHGGFRLNKRPEDISIADVADAVDVGPPADEVNGSRAYSQNLRSQLAAYNHHILAKITIAEVLKTGLSDYAILTSMG
jgi:DNA-binding IscR family transcriptional regulator